MYGISGWIIMNNKLAIIWNEVVVAQFQVLTIHMLGETEENGKEKPVRIISLQIRTGSFLNTSISKNYHHICQLPVSVNVVWGDSCC
jgi:hypothetical protein